MLDSRNFRIALVSLILVFATIQPTLADTTNHENKHNTNAMQQDKADTNFGHPGDPAKADRTIAVTAMDMSYKPTSIAVTRGETVRFVVTNKGKLRHEFVLGPKAEQIEHDKEMRDMSQAQMAQDMKNDRNGIAIEPGQTKTITWTFTTDLDHMQYACHIPGHYQAGMFGTIHIRHR